MTIASQKFGAILAAMLMAASCGAVASASTGAVGARSAGNLNAGTVKVDGFRSAKWGMTMAQTRAAIEQDFKLKGSAVVASVDVGQGTKVLTITVPDLLQGGGKAQVSYVFGANSQKLMEVNVVWATAIDPAITPETLVQSASALARYFATAGYVSSTVKTGLVAKNGTVMIFSGADKEGHATLLLLNREAQKDAAGKPRFRPTSLLLAYSADPAKPDVLRIKPGQF